MRLGNLIAELSDVTFECATDENAFAELEIAGFAIDHRKIAKDTVFGAFKGASFNGEDFIGEAVAAGAAAIVTSDTAVFNLDAVSGALIIKSTNPRKIFAQMAARFFTPMPNMVAAITGTNGKTSTAELTRQFWRMSGHHAASIGTLGITTASDQVSTGLTTPDIVTFLANMSGLAKEGVSHVAFEASSHGLDQYRTAGVPVQIGAFTNLSRDHLDYHGDMESYFEAKMRLFDEMVGDDGTAVIWADDIWSDKVIARAKLRGLRLITVGERGQGIKLVSRKPTQLGQDLEIEIQGEVIKVKLPLIGGYQSANALMAAAITMASGEAVSGVMANLARLQPVRGRLERAAIARSGAPVYVDYAHTPDALVAAIAAMRPHTAGRLITVFGAGGDRDRGKRPEMGRVAFEASDIAIVTDDNPRIEDPQSIRAEILAGAPQATEIADRREAIAYAISISKADDIVLIAGKGHEQGQIIGDRILPFDDVQVARESAA
jgi:UDP-N-acetylmuramoyl-L-alanyl-D-glutamate--2,6-diaminopimelate ligase